MLDLKDYILHNLDQVLIYSIYLGIPEDEISYNIANNNHKTSNPLRTDSDPSLSFKWYGNKLIAKDFGDPRFRGDIFEIVGYCLNLNVKNGKDFVKICNHILDDTYNGSVAKTNIKLKEASKLRNEKLKITYESRPLRNIDYEYFNKFAINRRYVDKYVEGVLTYYLDGWKSPYKYRGYDPCYCYNVNPNSYKLYFPYRTKGDKRFITNNKAPIEGLHLLRPVHDIIIIKAFKDMMLFNQMLDDFKVTDILVLPAASETFNMSKQLYSLLLKYCPNGNIHSILDLDRTGIEKMKQLEDQFAIKPIYFTQDYGVKDPTDMAKKYDYKVVCDRFEEILNIL